MASTDPKPTTDREEPVEAKPEQKPTALGEDDEFEDFPVEGTFLSPNPLFKACQRSFRG